MRNIGLIMGPLGSLLVFLQPSLPAQSLTRGPSIWETDSSSFRVSFLTSSSVQGSIEWGPTEALGNTATGASTTNHAIRITGLLPDHFYWYRVRLAGNPVTPAYRTRTFASAGSDVTFFVFGDCGTGSSGQTRVADLLQTWDWDLGLLPGDIIYPDGQASGFNPYFFTPYAATLRTTPFYPTLGNHDRHTSSGQPYLDAFYLPTGNSSSERWYSFDHGKVHFIGLDSEGISSSQTAWLRSDLTAARAAGAQWIFATFHHPGYSSGTGHGREQSIYQNWCPIFEEFEVDAVFQGHDHIYERTSVRRDFYPNNRGVVYFVVGTGGAGLYGINPEPYSAYATAKQGILKVDVRGNVFRSTFIDGSSGSALGQQLDTYTMTRGAVTSALRATSPSPQPGQSFQGAFVGPNGAFCSLFAALQPDYVSVPNLGLVHLGTPSQNLAHGLIGSSQSTAFSLAVPNTPALVGTGLYFQGVTVEGAAMNMQLTDVLHGRVR
ncbi:MAG TPA: metallophosphoesterase [Planctomycetota bacterium]|nr:metallophosphoesterase [Planctomycetota bacterium]